MEYSTEENIFKSIPWVLVTESGSGSGNVTSLKIRCGSGTHIPGTRVFYYPL